MKTDRQTLIQSEYYLQTYNTHTIIKGPPQEVPTTILQHSYTKGTTTPHPLPPTHSKYHSPSYNIHTPTILQHSYTKGTHYPPPPIPNPQEVPPTILQHSYTKGTPHPPPPYPQPTGSTTPSYNS